MAFAGRYWFAPTVLKQGVMLPPHVAVAPNIESATLPADAVATKTKQTTTAVRRVRIFTVLIEETFFSSIRAGRNLRKGSFQEICGKAPDAAS
jgi:hypothetical protein